MIVAVTFNPTYDKTLEVHNSAAGRTVRAANAPPAACGQGGECVPEVGHPHNRRAGARRAPASWPSLLSLDCRVSSLYRSFASPQRDSKRIM